MNLQAQYLVLKDLVEGQDTVTFGQYRHDIIYRLINISFHAQQNAQYKYRSNQPLILRQNINFNDDDILNLIEQAINKGAVDNQSYPELGTPGEYAFHHGLDQIAAYLLKSSEEIEDPHSFVQLCVKKSMFLLLYKFLSLSESVPPANQETLLPSILNIFISHVNKERLDPAASAVTQKHVFQLIEVAIQKGALCNIVIDPVLKECPNSPLAIAFFLDCQNIVELLMIHDAEVVYLGIKYDIIPYAISIHRHEMLRAIFIKKPELLAANMQEIPQFLAACGIFGELHQFLMNDQNILSPCAKNSLIPQILNAFKHQKYSEEEEKHIVDLVILSCNKGANTNMPVGYERDDCLQVAIRNNWKFIAQTLLAHSKAPHYSHGIEYSFVEYAANFNMEMLVELFSTNAELFSQDEILQFYASTARFAELGACLLGQDTSLSEYTKSHIIFEIIIISLCNNSWRKPPVQMEYEAIEIIRLAVAKGAYIDAHQNQYSKITPLMIAAERGIDLLFFSLIECGANLYAIDSRKSDAFNYALRSDHEKLCMDIMDKYPNVLDYQNIALLIQLTARLGSYDLCKKIIEFTGNKLLLELRESIIFDIIYGVSTAALEEKATLLISDMHRMGANINVQKKDTGVTPLMHAAEKKFTNIIKFLVEHHADLNATNKEGCTVNSYASPEIKWIIENHALHLIGNQVESEDVNDQILSI